MLSDSGTASSTRILQEVPSLERKVTHRDAQIFLANLCRDKWLKQEVGCWRSFLAFINPPIFSYPLPIYSFFLSPPPSHFQSGVLSPGPRFVLELRPFLQELFGDDVSHCHLCKDPAIQVSLSLSFTPSLLTKILYFLSQGQKCSCGTKLHLYCAAKLFNARSVKTDCLPPVYH